jgi:hypothetical protein
VTVFVNPLTARNTALVTTVGNAEGSRGAAAALACAAADPDTATLLVDVGGRAPRPTLIATAAARQLEERLRTHLPESKVAARGQVCHLAVPAEPEGLELASAAATAARESGAVFHVPPELLHVVLSQPGCCPSGVLLRADLADDRALVALAVRDLIGRDLPTVVLKRRLAWVAERRAMFGVLPAGAPGGLPERVVRRLVEVRG